MTAAMTSALMAGVILLLAAGGSFWAWLWTGRAIVDTARDRLTLYETSLDAAVERFRYLPEFMALTEPVRALLEAPDPTRAVQADAHLLRIARSAGADVLFVMNADGLTLAASNAGEPTSFVGQNYAFRPYYRAAIEAGSGRYYAVGATTGKPGYFLASRIDGPQGPLGVAVVKVDLAPLEAEWRRTAEKVALVDEQGVVFLATDPAWLYHPLAPLAPDALRYLEETRKYGSPPQIGPPLTQGSSTRFGLALTTLQPAPGQAETLFELAHPLPGHGWRLMLLAPVTRASEMASLAAFSVLVLGLVAFLASTVLAQRRAHARARERAHAELERRVEERTLALREAQDGLVQSAKLAGLGQGLAGIAHEMAQPLAAMRVSLASLAHFIGTGDKPKALGTAEGLAAIADRVEKLAAQLRNFARPDKEAPRRVSLQDLVHGAVSLIEHRLKAQDITLARHLPAGPVVVEARPNRLEQVIVNLLANAIDASEEAARLEPRARRIDVTLTIEEGDACLRVEDEGPGLGDLSPDRVFEPFFSTKATGRGLGLGLSISRGIMAEHGGRLGLSPRVARGVAAELRLPLAPREGDAR
ncbi:ATP-binding protein [Rhabdaerophilum sp. SD176]|uniref:ATP-binding protein n=1 Tax=Rhabdaerophilum sp. SD176 TaxID=2983548 RepID=UPI0024E025F3|nr:ATP-binding protein [Rhabdaerophilum sp. SD176]